MIKQSTVMASALFFCTTGWVYDSCVARADTAGPNDSANQSTPASLFANTPPTSAATATDNLDKSVKVGSFGQIDLHVKDQDLTKILQLLSIQSQRNIIVSKGITGAVTADLYGVDFYQAMDALLHSNGYGYVEKGNFIYVYTTAELKQIQDADRKTLVKVMRLNYINADDASKFCTPLLSKDGAITLSGAVAAGFTPSPSDGGANSYAQTDTLIIRDYPENIAEVEKVVKELDIRPKQVLVEATVLDAELKEDNAFGVDMTILAHFGLADLAGSTLSSLVNGGAQGSGQAIQWTNTSMPSGQTANFKIGVTDGKNIAAVISALDKVTDTTVIANPKILVLNRQKAQILVGTRQGYISTTTSTTTSTQTVDFLDGGTKLTVRPFVSDDGMVRMEVKPEISAASLDPAYTTITVPVQSTKELTTNVMVKSGQTVILGGLFTESTTVGKTQVPYVGDIPIVGAAFSGHSNTVTRNEYIFMITPTIMKDQVLYAAGDDATHSVDLARIGAREGLLPFARSKMTSAYVADAVKAMEAGDKSKALWSADIALSMDPTFIEARKIKDQVTGQQVYSPTDSIFEDAVGSMMKQMKKESPAVSSPQPTTIQPSAIAPQPAPTPAPQASAPTPAPLPGATDAPAVTAGDVTSDDDSQEETEAPTTQPSASADGE